MTTVSPLPADVPMHQRVNVAPMGPIVDASMTQLLLRPFTSSTTYQNLKATGEGVFHVTDDALLIAQAAIGSIEPMADAPMRPADHVQGLVLTGACRYYEVKVVELDDREARTRIRARVVSSGRLRDFFGFNRARHAVLEAAIAATRVHLTGPGSVLVEFERLQVVVDKTGSDVEQDAMRQLWAYVRQSKCAGSGQ